MNKCFKPVLSNYNSGFDILLTHSTSKVEFVKETVKKWTGDTYETS